MVSLIVRWYRRMQLNALAREYDRMASKAERMDWPLDSVSAYREHAYYLRCQARRRNPHRLPRFVVP